MIFYFAMHIFNHTMDIPNIYKKGGRGFICNSKFIQAPCLRMVQKQGTILRHPPLNQPAKVIATKKI